MTPEIATSTPDHPSLSPHWTDEQRDNVAKTMAEIARSAGDALLALHNTGLRAEWKSDGSPVSEADRAAEAIIEAGLRERFPDIAIVSEENAASQSRTTPELFFLVDPLDGTRAFLRGGPDFCVLIALIERGVPIAAAIDAPARKKRYWAGRKAFMASTLAEDQGQLLPTRGHSSGRTAIISAHHANEASRKLCASLGVDTILTENSALKFARVAEGEADLYPRVGTTMEWDVAAGDALLRALGGGVLDLSGALLRYGQPGTSWEVPGFIARGRLA